jgi:hypothetical protein
MSVTKERFVKIAAIAGDMRGDPATRAMARAMLEEIHATNPELFVVEKVPSIDDSPPWDDDEDAGLWDIGDPGLRGLATNPERDAFLDPRLWRH